MKAIKNSYLLPNVEDRMSPDDLRRSLSDFEFFMGNYQQITNKERKVVPFKLNDFQKKFFETMLPLVKKETRLEKRHNVVVLKSRQVGASVSTVAFINYICSFVDGMENLSIAHTFPVTDTISKFYTKKVEPIISGVHPDLYPNIERETLGSSIITRYNDIKGIRRNNYYELVSAGASSIRSDTVNIWIADEVAMYAHPEVLEDAVSPAIPDYGFSLVVYLSTFEDRKSDYFLSKIKTAIDNPEDWTILFLPWFLTYPERPAGVDLSSLNLTEYDNTVIMPAMAAYGVPQDRWGDCIDWYHRRSLMTSNMKKEYPTTVEEVLTLGDDKTVFSPESIERQRANIMEGTPYRLVTDNATRKVEAHKTEESPFRIFKNPMFGHKYRLVVDPITAVNEDTDIFAMNMFDINTLEQVATFNGNDMPLEDYADFAVSMCKIYNNAEICPETNVAEAFIVLVRALGYYFFYYENPQNRAKKIPGIRTTATSKENMIDKLKLLLDTDRIKLHDKETIDELTYFERKIKKRVDGGQSVRMAARKGHHDDNVATLWIFAGSLDQRQMAGSTGRGWAIL